MTGNKRRITALDLMYAIGNIDESLLTKCENYPVETTFCRRKIFIASVSAAACFCMIIMGVFLNKKSIDFAENTCLSDNAIQTAEDNCSAETSAGSSEVSETESSDVTSDFSDASYEEEGVEESIESIEEEIQYKEECEVSAKEEPIRVNLSNKFSGDHGFEGLMYYGDDDFYENYTLDKIQVAADTLPVYKNISYNEYGIAFGMTYEELTAKFNILLEYFGIEGCNIQECVIGENQIGIDEDYVYGISSFRADGVMLQVYADGSWTVSFYESKREKSPYDSEEDSILYFIEKYNELFGFESFGVKSLYSRNIYGELHGEYYVYEKSSNEIENLLNKTFSKVNVFMKDGYLVGFSVGSGMSYTEKLGDYPIIAEEEAKEALKSNEYVSTVPKEFIGDGIITDEKIMFAEIIYRNSSCEEIFIPYYKFMVKLTAPNPQTFADGLANYGAFYVPAVEKEYIENYEIFNDQFN